MSLDREVAEKVMGWSILVVNVETPLPWDVEEERWVDASNEEQCDREEFCPSTNIADAWRVVEKLIDADDCWTFDLGLNAAGEYVCSFDDYTESEGIADTAPEAICRAALQAVK